MQSCRISSIFLSSQFEHKKSKNFTSVYTGCDRNSELIINKNNVLLQVIDTNFSTSQFTMVLNFFLHSFHFLCTMSFRWPPPSSVHKCTRVKKLHITAWSVSSESLAISSCMFSFWVHVSLYGDYCTLYFSNNPTEKSLELIGPANEEAVAHHRNEKPPSAETNGEAQRC